MSDGKPPPDARTVTPGQAVTCHEGVRHTKVEFPGDPANPRRLCERGPLQDPNARLAAEARNVPLNKAWTEMNSAERQAVADADVVASLMPPPGTERWRRVAIRSVPAEQSIAGRAQLTGQELDRLVDGLMMRLDGPPPDSDAQEARNILAAALDRLDGQHSSSLVDCATRAVQHLEVLAHNLKAREAQVEAQAQEIARLQTQMSADESTRESMRLDLIGRDAQIDSLSQALLQEMEFGTHPELPVAQVSSDQERRVVAFEHQVAELRGNRDVHANVISELIADRDTTSKSIVSLQAQSDARAKHEPNGRVLREYWFGAQEQPKGHEHVVQPKALCWTCQRCKTRCYDERLTSGMCSGCHRELAKPVCPSCQKRPAVPRLQVPKHDGDVCQGCWDSHPWTYDDATKALFGKFEHAGSVRADFQRLVVGLLREIAPDVREALGLPRSADVTLWSAQNRPLRPGDVWCGPDGTVYDVVPAWGVGDRPRWWVGPKTTRWPEVSGDLHLGKNHSADRLALVRAAAQPDEEHREGPP